MTSAITLTPCDHRWEYGFLHSRRAERSCRLCGRLEALIRENSSATVRVLREHFLDRRR